MTTRTYRGSLGNVGMVKQSLRIIERGLCKFAVCARCNAQFRSKLLYQSEAEHEIREKYASHKCTPTFANENTARIAREATEKDQA